MTGFSFEQASAALVDATRTAAPSAAQVSLGRRLSARYRQASETALAWLEASGGGEVGG
jgi:hypothetical protein